MCYSKVPYWIVNDDKRERQVRYLPAVQAQVSAVSRGSTGGVDGAGMRKFLCVCSPTLHPGSFRCRYHHADYKWVARLRHKA